MSESRSWILKWPSSHTGVESLPAQQDDAGADGFEGEGFSKQSAVEEPLSARALSNREVAELYRGYAHLVLRRGRAIFRNDALAHDLVQDVFMRVILYGGAVREAGSIRGWLFSVADRCAIDLIQRRRRDRLLGLLSRARGSSLEPEQPPPPFEERSLLGQLSAKLPADHGLVALLLSEGFTQHEIAERTGWSRQTVN